VLAALSATVFFAWGRRSDGIRPPG
jgi:hypothetical protein